MESKTNLSEIQNQFLSALSDHYPENEIRQIFSLTAEHLLNYSKIDIILKSSESISADESGKFEQILKRLKQWEPIQYILGYCSFYGLTFNADKRVLIPRQETEELVHWIIGCEGDRPSEFLDIGTGSGCIAVSLAANLHQVKVSACDISMDALALAKDNAQLNKVNVSFFGLDLLHDVISLPSKYRVIVSNPPYVRQCEKVMMMPNVLDYEPALALFVPDKDPLLYYKRIALLARKYLLDGGALYLEINEQFPGEIVKLLQSTGFYSVEVKEDLNGKKRMVRGRK
jgi:release factor glutamine methyltransferase